MKIRNDMNLKGKKKLVELLQSIYTLYYTNLHILKDNHHLKEQYLKVIYQHGNYTLANEYHDIATINTNQFNQDKLHIYVVKKY